MSEGVADALRPTVTLKIATSLDGRIATADGQSRWITNEASREQVHRLRAAHDAVLVGSQTVIDDDPELTVRLPGYEGGQPLRVVADARLRTPGAARVLNARTGAALIVTSTSADARAWMAENPDAALLQAPPQKDGAGVNPLALVEHIAKHVGASPPDGSGRPARILLEGGGQLAASLFRADLIDRIEWFRAPILLGGDARPAVAALELAALERAPRFVRTRVRELGVDLWESYERAASAA